MSKKKNHPGRKPFEEGQRKDVNLRIRLTEVELQFIKRLHGRNNRKSVSTMVRDVVLKERIDVEILNRNFQGVLQELISLRVTTAKLLKSKSQKIEDLKPIISKLQDIVEANYFQMEGIKLELTDLKEWDDWSPSSKSLYRNMGGYKKEDS